ncbi:MAG TPA: UbiA family prenyltransferase [Vicinamibacterales bacterium]|nr:UbiA family prenyltransferase [Vicinamibacterales bacterium]
MQERGGAVEWGPWLRLVHYWWPILLGWSVAIVSSAASGSPLSSAGLGVLLWGICGAYSLDRLLDPSYHRDPRWLRLTLTAGFLISSAACLPLIFRLPIGTAALVPALALAGLFYRRLKQYPATKTVLVPLVWVWAAVALPLADGSWFGWRAVLQPVSLPLAALIGAGCLLCDIKDADQDRRTGVKSLPVRVGVTRTIAIATALSILGAALAWLQHRTGLVITAVVLAGLGQWTSLLAAGPVGALLVDVVLTLPGLLIATHLV